MARGWLLILVLWLIIFMVLMQHSSWTASAWKTAAWALLWAIVAGILTAAFIFALVTFFN